MIVELGGDLGAAIRASASSRLKKFIQDEDSEALKLFHPDQKDKCSTGDWYGEHAGKWLMAAGLTYQANKSAEWQDQVARVVDYLAAQQENSGYLGTYAAEAQSRMTHEKAEEVRTWDIWIHAWMLLGLLEVAGIPGCEKAEPTAKKIGELMLAEFGGSRSPAAQGNHSGLSSLVILEPLAIMASRWKDSRYSELALKIFNQAVDSGLDFWNAKDASQIGTGKSYQLLWCLKGILELGLALAREDLIGLAKRIWLNVRDHHLTPMGGPWGGIATHKEVFNPPDFFDPSGMVETCSSVTWMILSHRLFEVTGKSSYLAEAEKTLYNSVLGAIDENGADWCYFIFPNGRRNNTYHWACCKSSGAIGLAFAEAKLVGIRDGVTTLIFLESCSFSNTNCTEIEIEIASGEVIINSKNPTPLAIFISAGFELIDLPSGARLEGDWLKFDSINGVVKFGLRKRFQVEIRAHSVDHHGQEIVRVEYVCARLGRDVLATGKFEGYRTLETLRMPQLAPESVFEVVGESSVELRQAGRDPILLTPYWNCGGRHDGAWRTSWLQVAWQ